MKGYLLKRKRNSSCSQPGYFHYFM